MSRLLPFEFPVSWSGEEPLLADIDGEEAGEVFDALSSETARTVLAQLYEDPQPASRLAEHTDTSLQNVRYHLEKLSDAGLVEVADTWYSERGREMAVYAPTREGVVLFAGRDKERTLRALLSRIMGAVGIVGVLVAAVSVVRRYGLPATSSESGGSNAGAQTTQSGASGASGASGTTTTAASSGGTNASAGSGAPTTISGTTPQTTQGSTTHLSTTHVSATQTTVETTQAATHTTTAAHSTTVSAASHAATGMPPSAWLWLLLAVAAVAAGYYLLATR